jgi:hypothetical protein
VEQWKELKQVLVEHCDRIGRDPSTITCSVNIRLDQGIEPAVAQASAYRDAGVDLAIMNLPHTAKPDLLAPLADALGHLG